MGKNNKKGPAIEAPVVEAAAVKEEDNAASTIVNMAAGKGLTQSEKLQFATELRHRVSELKEEDNPPLEMIKGYNIIRDITFIDLAAGEIACGSSATGFIFSGNEMAYKALCGLALTMGVKMPDFKTLPAPTKEQLHNAGIAGIGETKYVSIESKDVSKETKEKKKKERKINEESDKADKDYLKDHTKIKTPEQLSEALGFQLVNLKVASPVERLITTAQFYRSYLEAHAEKSDNPEAELAKIHENTLSDLLQDITTMVEPTFAIEGFGKHLCKLAESTGSIVPAYNLFKKAAIDRKTGRSRFSDEEIAVLVKIIVVWNATATIANISKDIKILNKDAKANAKAIEKCTTEIQHQQSIIALVSEPDFDIADNFVAAYKDEENGKHKLAVALYNSIMSTYYQDVDIPELEMDTALLNVQQRIGIILNMFNSELGKRDDYSEENLIAFSTETEGKTPEEEGEKEPKNS